MAARRSIASSKAMQSKEYIQEAQDSLARGDYDQAELLAIRALEKNDDISLGYEVLGIASQYKE